LETRSRALNGAGRLAWYASDMTSASALLEEGLEAAKQSGDRSALIYATRTLSRVAAVGGQAERGRELGRESVRLARESGEDSLLLESLMDLAFADFNVGDFEGVERGAREALILARGCGDDGAQALALSLLANRHEQRGKLDEALALIQQSEAICRRLGLQWELCVALALLGQIWSKKGETALSQKFYNEALSICRETSLTTWHVVTTLLSMSWSWVRRGEMRGAVTVMGAAHSLSETLGYTLMPILVPTQKDAERKAREQLGEIAFGAAFSRGQHMTPEQAVEFAINPVSST
jgi:tetratricopeptide (TPR) repeat protein